MLADCGGGLGFARARSRNPSSKANRGRPELVQVPARRSPSKMTARHPLRSVMFPGHASQGTAAALVSPAPDEELVRLTTSRGTTIAAAFGAALLSDSRVADDAAARVTVLLFYGNGMCLADTMGLDRSIRTLGVNVMVPDYVGYGMSGGVPSERGLYETGDACWLHLQSRPDVDASNVVVAGISMGGAVAIDLASRFPVAGLAVFSTFTNLSELVRAVAPRMPLGPFVRGRFDSLSKVARVEAPALFVHGRNDSMIPFAMSARLSAAAERSRGITTLAVDSDHNDLFVVAKDEVLKALGSFLHGLA